MVLTNCNMHPIVVFAYFVCMSLYTLKTLSTSLKNVKLKNTERFRTTKKHFAIAYPTIQ